MTAAYACEDAILCAGTVPNGAALDTSRVGIGELVVRAEDDAGNPAELRRAYTVHAPPPPPPPPVGPAGQREPPPQPIEVAPPRPGEPDTALPTPRTLNAARLVPRAGARVGTRRPVLRWPGVPGATLYNVQLFRVTRGEFVKVYSAFPRGTRLRVPAGRLSFGERYAWRVWPFRARGGYPADPMGVSWFDVQRPVRLTAAQLLVNQRIAQAALRRVNAIDAWLNAGLVTGDLRDGGLGREAFSPDVTLAGDGEPFPNGAASPRPLVVPAASGGGGRVEVTGLQMLVNQRIAQAAIRRAAALERRLDGRLTGGDLRPGAATPVKLAPGLFVAGVVPGASAIAPSRTETPPGPAGGRALRPTAAQALVNQRIAQAAVRRSNALRERIAGGLAGDAFRPGSIGPRAVTVPGARAAGAPAG